MAHGLTKVARDGDVRSRHWWLAPSPTKGEALYERVRRKKAGMIQKALAAFTGDERMTLHSLLGKAPMIRSIEAEGEEHAELPFVWQKHDHFGLEEAVLVLILVLVVVVCVLVLLNAFGELPT